MRRANAPAATVQSGNDLIKTPPLFEHANGSPKHHFTAPLHFDLYF